MRGNAEMSRRGFLLGWFSSRRGGEATAEPASATATGTSTSAAPRLTPTNGPVSGSAAGPQPASSPAVRRPPVIPVLRPPGAVEETAFLAGCTRCRDCERACPHRSIIMAPARLRAAAGTPMIDPSRAPCWMCADTPCITACQPGVLVKAEHHRMGTARIEPFQCLAHQGSFCTVCSERCPVPGAIELSTGRPKVVPEVCTGCGVCQYVCPAPVSAVLVLPTLERPASPFSSEAR